MRSGQRAYQSFHREASTGRGWGVWTGSGRRLIGPLNAAGVARAYRRLLAATLLIGVVFTLVGGVLARLGTALVVGCVFAFGAWMAQAWALSREAEFRIEDMMLSELERERLAPLAERIIALERQRREIR
ncbi:hypothetical protein [Catenuloplanes atrovinosus]|uniref:Uncharacterized protein n=1 Tax=Catenuloplanes atrovinosus TaxID=137266 RepID=A0AAE3YNR2_9ACTN|nr:hypothetical protein [Catenuloplanes atrovinosus]MDR7275121.1 hypothetical protein [Catenuloplanes atrovinosus]